MLQAITSRIKDKRLSEEDVTNNVLKSLEIGDDSQLNSKTKSSKGVTDYPILEFDENALQLLHEGVSNPLKYSKVVPAKGRLYEAVKRLFDIVASACALALLVIPIDIYEVQRLTSNLCSKPYMPLFDAREQNKITADIYKIHGEREVLPIN